jgi:hypothetical protein
MDSVDSETGARHQPVEEGNQLGMVDILHLPASPADQVVVVPTGYLVDQLTMTDMRYQNQPLFDQEVQGAIDSRLGHAGQLALHLLEDLAWSEVLVGFGQHAQDSQALGSQAETLGTEMEAVCFREGHGCEYFLLQVDAIERSIP